MLKSESLIAFGIMAFSVYLMWHALVLPIGWVEGQGPGGGAFPFWLSAIMFAAASGILLRALRRPAPETDFFDRDTIGQVASVFGALVVTVALLPVLGAYVAILLFLVWYLRFYGQHGWTLTLAIVIGTLAVMFFLFEVVLRILLPKGVTEPLFLPLYAIFF